MTAPAAGGPNGDLAPGTRVGRYRVTHHVGAGATGDVYAADGPHGPVAVKVVRASLADRPGLRQRLAREASLARRAEGPGVVRLLEVDTTVARPYLVMDYVPAPDLGRVVRDGGVLADERLDRFAASLLAAVSHIHRSGIVHRDLKPANVLVGTDGTAHVTDFGIALDGEHLDVPESRGTAGWLAPEVLGGSPPTAASDVYGVGRLVLFAATGRADASTDLLPAPWRSTIGAALAADPAARGAAYVPAVFARRFLPAGPDGAAADGGGGRRPRRFGRRLGRRPIVDSPATEPPSAVPTAQPTIPIRPGRRRRRVRRAGSLLLAALAVAALSGWAIRSIGAPSSLVVYDEEFAPGFSLNTFNGHNDARSALAVRSGSVALATTPSSYGGFYISVDDGVALSGFRTIRFWVHGGTAGTSDLVVVGQRDVWHEAGSARVGDVPAGAWRRVELDLREITGGAAFDGDHQRLIGFLNRSPEAHAPLMFDRIELLRA